MTLNHTNLNELLNELQALQNTQEEETTKIRRRLAWLESRRRELFDTVALNNSDFETRRKLEDTENQLLELQQALSRTEADLKSGLQEVRQRIIAMRNEELTRLEQEVKALRGRRDEIHNELLPAAQNRVAELMEEETKLGQRTDDLSRRIRDLNQLDLPTSQVA